jgi:hypothetical protein
MERIANDVLKIEESALTGQQADRITRLNAQGCTVDGCCI